jgi:hypothetical protein
LTTKLNYKAMDYFAYSAPKFKKQSKIKNGYFFSQKKHLKRKLSIAYEERTELN